MSSKSVKIEGDLSLILFQLNLNMNAKKIMLSFSK